MENQNNVNGGAEQTAETKSVMGSLAQKVMKFLRLDDASKIQAFFNREAKHSKSQIETRKHNIQALELQYKQDINRLEEELEDAEISLEDSKIAVTVEDVKTNDLMDAFARDYWGRIEANEERIASLKKALVERKETLDKAVADIREGIAKHEKRIALMK